MAGPLNRIRVVDCTRGLAGPRALITHENAEALFRFPLSKSLIDAFGAPGA